MLSELLGESPDSVRGAGPGQPTNFRVSDVVDATEVPLLIQENRIKNEQDPEKRQALERQYHALIRVSTPLPLHCYLQSLFLNRNMQSICL